MIKMVNELTAIVNRYSNTELSVPKGKNDHRELTKTQISIINFMKYISSGVEIGIEGYDMTMLLRIMYIATKPGSGKSAIVSYSLKHELTGNEVLPVSSNGPVSSVYERENVEFLQTSLLIIPENLLSHWENELKMADTSYVVFTTKTGRLTKKYINSNVIVIPMDKLSSNLPKYNERRLERKLSEKFSKYFNSDTQYVFRNLFIDESVRIFFKYQEDKIIHYNSLVVINSDGFVKDEILNKEATDFNDIDRSIYDINKYVPNFKSYIEIRNDTSDIEYDSKIVYIPEVNGGSDLLSNADDLYVLFETHKYFDNINKRIETINGEIEYYNETGDINMIDNLTNQRNSLTQVFDRKNDIERSSEEIMKYLLTKQILIVCKTLPSCIVSVLKQNNINYTTSEQIVKDSNLVNEFEKGKIRIIMINKYEHIRGIDNMKNADGMIIFNSKKFLQTELYQIMGRILRLGRTNPNKPFIVTFSSEC